MTANQLESRLHRMEQFMFGNDPKKWPKGYLSDSANKQALGIEKVICEYFNLLILGKTEFTISQLEEIVFRMKQKKHVNDAPKA